MIGDHHGLSSKEVKHQSIYKPLGFIACRATMVPFFIKAFTVRVSTKRRRELKYKLFMSASHLLHEARILYAISASEAENDLVEMKMEVVATRLTDEFTRRCRRMTRTSTERRYIGMVISKHILPALNFVFDKHMTRLARLDTLNILNNTRGAPRFLLRGKMERFKELMETMNKKVKIEINI
jgi:hypothetical protein